MSIENDNIDYEYWRAELAPYHRFSFGTTKHFTPQQKSAITRAKRRLEEGLIRLRLGQIDRSDLPYAETHHADEWYSDKYNLLKNFHNFSFRKRKRFTGSQKAAITKKNRELKNYVKGVEEGEASFRRVRDRAKLRRLTGRFKATNRGIFIYERRARVEQIRDRWVTRPDTGRRVKTTVIKYRVGPVGIDTYIPRPSGMNIIEFVTWVFKIYKPKRITLATGRSQGTRPYTYKQFMNHSLDFIGSEEDIAAEDFDPEEVFHGVYIHKFEYPLEKQMRKN